MNLSRHVKGNMKGFCKYINKRTEENVSVLLNEAGDLLTKDSEGQHPQCLIGLGLYRYNQPSGLPMRPGQKSRAYSW